MCVWFLHVCIFGKKSVLHHHAAHVGVNYMYCSNLRFFCPTGKNIVYILPNRDEYCAHLLWYNTMLAPKIYTFIMNWICKLTECGVMLLLTAMKMYMTRMCMIGYDMKCV